MEIRISLIINTNSRASRLIATEDKYVVREKSLSEPTNKEKVSLWCNNPDKSHITRLVRVTTLT